MMGKLGVVFLLTAAAGAIAGRHHRGALVAGLLALPVDFTGLVGSNFGRAAKNRGQDGTQLGDGPENRG